MYFNKFSGTVTYIDLLNSIELVKPTLGILLFILGISIIYALLTSSVDIIVPKKEPKTFKEEYIRNLFVFVLAAGLSLAIRYYLSPLLVVIALFLMLLLAIFINRSYFTKLGIFMSCLVALSVFGPFILLYRFNNDSIKISYNIILQSGETYDMDNVTIYGDMVQITNDNSAFFVPSSYVARIEEAKKIDDSAPNNICDCEKYSY